jgi:DNA-binding protein HU-beta
VRTKPELIAHLSAVTGYTKNACALVIDALTDAIHVRLKAGEDFVLPTVGRLTAREVAPRIGHSPKNGAPFEVGRRLLPKFVPSSQLKRSVR